MRAGWWEDLGLSEMLGDMRENAFEIFHDMSVFQPNDRQAQSLEVVLPRMIIGGGLLAVVGSAFKFNDESFSGAIEVDDIGANALLAAKFSLMKTRTPERSPKNSFGWCQVSAQDATPCHQTVSVIQSWRC